jgi:YcxB-like protein
MEIEFELTRADYGEYLKLAYARMFRIGKGGMKFFVLNIVTWVFIGMGVTGIIRFYELYDGIIELLRLNLALLFLGLSVIWLLGVTVYQRKFYLRYAIDEQGYLLKKQKANFTDDGITIFTSDSKQTYSWAAIQGNEDSSNLACLFIDNGQALIFPKSAFNSDFKMDEYRSLVKSKISYNNQVNKDASR